MLEIKNISKYFNSKLVLDDISFKVHKGNIFGIIGPNGAGKTTTLRIILGILFPSNGEVLFKNKKVTQEFMNITGYLPEERGLYPKSNVVNTLIYLGQLKGLSYSQAVEKTNYWLERLNLLEYQKFNIDELSKGNQQKIQFLTSILHEPKILILDEPFSGFDPVNQSIFREIIEEIKNDCIIILSTHLMDLAESLCDEIFLINNGKEIISGELNKLLKSSNNNLYEITLADNISSDKINISEKYKVLSKHNSSIIIDFEDKNPSTEIKEISNLINVLEIKRKSLTLNDLFLSLVENNNE